MQPNSPSQPQDVLPTSQSVLTLLKQLSPDPEFSSLRHTICVGDAAATIATALQAKGFELDVDKVRTLGYLHDIGRLIGPGSDHIINGYEFLKAQGFPEDYCNICLVHSYPENDPACILSTPPDPVRDKLIFDFLPQYTYSLSEKVVILCDLMCKYSVMTIDKRIVDVLSRHGTWEGTQNCILAVLRLKSEIDGLLGYSVYDLFPEIRENL